MLMKKSLIALAVASALTVPMVAQADATLYGSLRLSLNNLSDRDMDLSDNVSRIGIKGDSALFDGTKAIYQFEQAVNASDGGWGGARLASIGVTGDFGTVNMGRQWSPFALWTVLPFHTGENSLSLTTAGYRAGTDATPTSGIFYHRLANTIAYVSPNMSGLQVAAVTVTDDNGNNEDLDAYNLAAKYSAGGLMVSASYVDVDGAEDHTSVGATYTVDNLKVGARYATTDYNTVGTDDVDQYSLIAKYTMDNTSFMANFVDHEGETDEKQWSLEVQQQLGKQARAYVAYIGEEDADGLEVGYRVDF
jgi:predicted porin